jgi:hypothetical protein
VSSFAPVPYSMNPAGCISGRVVALREQEPWP